LIPEVSEDIELSILKWDSIYEKELIDGSYHKNFESYLAIEYEDIHDQINEVKSISNIAYLEIGCGHFFFGQLIAEDCKLIIGLDICFSALRVAKKMLDEKGIENYLLIQGNILEMPLKDNIADLVYGGGVMEHLEETQACIDELYRVLKLDGVSFNSVPCLNLGSLTYRQLWGNIPSFPILKQVAEFIHIKLLGAKHMTFGYEMSFPKSLLLRMHKKSGFREVRIGRFRLNVVLDFVPPRIKKPFIWLAENCRLFWPMVKVTAKK